MSSVLAYTLNKKLSSGYVAYVSDILFDEEWYYTYKKGNNFL